MSLFDDPVHEQEQNPDEPNMTNCQRCGFPCNTETDPVCPWCRQTKRDDGYLKLRIPVKPDGEHINK